MNLEITYNWFYLQLSFKRDGEGEVTKAVIVLHSELAGMPFVWNFHCISADKSMVTSVVIFFGEESVINVTNKNNLVMIILSDSERSRSLNRAVFVTGLQTE